METTINFTPLLGKQVIIEDGDLEPLKGILRDTFKNRILLEVKTSEAPMEFAIDAIKAAVIGFDLTEFPDPEDKLYVQYEISPALDIKLVEDENT